MSSRTLLRPATVDRLLRELLLRMRGYFNRRSRVLDADAKTDMFGGIPTRDIITDISTVIEFAEQHPQRVDRKSEFDEWRDDEGEALGSSWCIMML
ncbi:hypothetical protein FRB99_007057 [Tulasnella sp. 403]|nr:hypothetical protein FRB99_007057 [Tulasnella sp. 403]